MKRFAVIILAVLMVNAFCGCTPTESEGTSSGGSGTTTVGYENLLDVPETSTAAGVDIAKLVQGGELSPITVKLGDDVMTAYDQYGEPTEHFDSATPYVTFDADNFSLYYDDSNDDNAVTSIVTFADCYNLRMGITTAADIKAQLGEPAGDDEVTGDDLYFMYDKSVTAERLSYDCGGNRLELYLVNGKLSVALLTSDTEAGAEPTEGADTSADAEE